MKKWILNNWPIKLFALFLAFLAWFIIIRVTDPVSTRSFDIPIEFINENSIIERGQVVDIVGQKTVPIIVETSRSILNTLSEEDFSATADFKQMYRDTQVPITVRSLNKNVSLSDIEQQQASVEVSIEDLVTVTRVVEYEVTGEPGSGYILGNISISPETISVTCPESVMPYIKTAFVSINADSLTEGQKVTAKVKIFDGNGDEIDVEGNDKISWSNDGMVSCSIGVLQIQTLDIVVKAEGADELPEGYKLIGIKSSPTQVSVSGDKENLSKLSQIDVPLQIGSLTASESRTIDIRNYLPQGVELYNSTNSVKLDVEIDHYEEKDITLDPDAIEFTGLAEGLTASAQAPDGIIVKIGGLTADTAKVAEESFTVKADLTDLTEGTHTVPLKITFSDEKCELIEQVITVDVTLIPAV